MRLPRRALALVLNLLLLQLSLVGGGAACASWSVAAGSGGRAQHGAAQDAHRERAAGERHGTSHGAWHHGATAHGAPAGAAAAMREGGVRGGTEHRATVADADEQPSRGAPHDMQHCATAVGCVTIALPSADAALARLPMTDSPVASSRADTPRSLVVAPEPPPPRG